LTKTKKSKTKKREGSRTTTLRILEVIEAICDSPGDGIAELGQKLKIPQPTLYKHIESLAKAGFLARDPTKRIVAGIRLRNIFFSSLPNEPLVAHRRAIMHDLMNRVQETTSLSVPNGLELYYFDRVEYNWPVSYRLGIGDKLPITGSASGLLYLSTMDPQVAIDVYRSQHASKPSRADEARFLRELETVQRQGFALDDEMFFAGMNGAAIPIRDQKGTWSAFLSMHGLKSRKDMKQVCEELPLLREAGDRLEQLYFGNRAAREVLPLKPRKAR
jgi:DNA-binding IclR family transcriptional regulator